MSDTYFNIKFQDSGLKDWLKIAINTMPNEVKKMVAETTVTGLKIAREETKVVTGESRKSWKQRKLTDYRRQIYSNDVAIRVLEGGRKEGMTKEKINKKSKRFIASRRIKFFAATYFIRNKIFPRIEKILQINTEKLFEKVIK